MSSRLREAEDSEDQPKDETADAAKRTVISSSSLFKDEEKIEHVTSERLNRYRTRNSTEDDSTRNFTMDRSKSTEEERGRAAFRDHKNTRPISPHLPLDSTPAHFLTTPGLRTAGIKGILKKSRSTSVDSDHSESSAADPALARQSSIALSQTVSEEYADEYELDDEEEFEEDVHEEEEDYGEDESINEDVTDEGDMSRQDRGGSSSGGSFEEMRSPSPDESLEKSSSISETWTNWRAAWMEAWDPKSNKNRIRRNRPSEVIQTSLADRFNQLQDAENAWKKKKSNSDLEPKMSLADRMKILKEKEEQWKNKGKGAANDSVQFTVAGRMAKKGLVTDTDKQESPLISLKKSNATPVKPHEEISTRSDINVEGDKRLDKLESFLDKLHSKGVGKSKPSTVEVTAETEKEIMTLDDDETFGSFYKPISPTSLQESSVIVTEEAFSEITADTPMLTSSVAEHKRAVRPNRRKKASRNPLKTLAARNDIRQGYTEQRLNVASLETKRIQVERMAKHSNLSDVALAGLASKENFRKVNLRSVKSTEVVTNNSAVPFHKLMLIRIKGRRHVQVRLVEPTSRSLNSGDCYLLITPKHCFMWSGEFANVIEKAKASEMASFVQAKRDLGCKAPQVTLLEEGINTDGRSAKEFWTLLGGKETYRGAGEPERTSCMRAEWWIQTAFTDCRETNWCHMRTLGPPSQVSLYLTPKRCWCLILGSEPLDPSCTNKDVPQTGEGRPNWALFGRLSSTMRQPLQREIPGLGGKEKRRDCSSRRNQVHSIARPTFADTELQPCDAKTLLDNEADPVKTVLEGVDVHRGHGIVRTEDGRQAELATVAVESWHIKEHILNDDSCGEAAEAGELSAGMSGRERTACFFWQGRNSSANEKGTSALMTVELGSHRGAQMLVSQGKEPPCFLQLFQEVESEATLLEVNCGPSSLRSRASLVLLSAQRTSSSCGMVARLIAEPNWWPKGQWTSWCRGSETVEFWKALGSQDKKAYDCMLQDPGKYNYTPRLFRLSASSGAFEGKEVLYPARVSEGVMAMPFLQENLYSAQQPALFLLDNRMEVYLWQVRHGDCATVLQRKESTTPPSGLLVLAGCEPSHSQIFSHIGRRREYCLKESEP
ncbi:hypothetical protein WMY93_010885 [Mugilogobius chulae]|uniref:Gelsolin-like domain-containing protein n=1 Tax=Mugilogobius chulae TaxID=88201 RepID=A0AAW0PK72_9GOBI